MENAVKKYWDISSEDYNKCVYSEFQDEKQLTFWKTMLNSILGKKSGMKIIDIGTGPGFIATVLKEIGHEATGLDGSDEMLKFAKENARKRGLDINFIKGDACDLQIFEDECFDAVISRNVVWTLPNLAQAFKEWQRIVKPGGRVIAICGKYNATGIHGLRRIWRFLGWRLVYLTEGRKPWKSFHTEEDDKVHELPLKNKKRPDEDIKLMEEAGLKVIEVKRNIQNDFRSFLNWLKYGFWGETYIIVAEK